MFNLPKPFTEYQIRLYCKTPKSMSEEAKTKSDRVSNHYISLTISLLTSTKKANCIY